MASTALLRAVDALLLAAWVVVGNEDEVSLLSFQADVMQRSRPTADGLTAGLPLLLQAAGHRRERTVPVPSVEINLDLPPEERWQSFFSRGDSEEAATFTRAMSGELGDAQRAWLSNIQLDPFSDLVRELRGVVQAVNSTGITVESLLWGMEFGYERGVTRGCTVVLAAEADGTVLHGRNLDLSHGSTLGTSLVDITYTRGGRPLFVSTTFPGTVGVHTGYRIGSYTVAQNTRHGCGDQECSAAAARAGGKPFSFVLRELLETVPDFESAVHKLAHVNLMAPQYFSLAGPGPFDGAVITRDRGVGRGPPFGNVNALSPQIGRWFVVQTNDDIYRPPQDRRRPAGVTKLEEIEQVGINESSMLSVMMTQPVLNRGTVFTWVCVPATGYRKMLLGSDELRAINATGVIFRGSIRGTG